MKQVLHRLDCLGPPHKQLMTVCKKLGAQEVLGPGNAGHSRHVRCGWSR
ncbi:hypothetical protein ACFRQM_21130 [Streptomyces sp. NPDC056831]